MLVTNTMEATASTTDSCQVSEPVTATQETPRTIATYTATTPAMHRKSFKEQEPAIFSIIGFAVAYIAALISTASSRREKLTINPTLWTSTKN